MMRIRTVAKEGVLAALAASNRVCTVGTATASWKLARAQVARLSEALMELAAKFHAGRACQSSRCTERVRSDALCTDFGPILRSSTSEGSTG
jgi:hypothetical protein